jgi:hypothetical protein
MQKAWTTYVIITGRTRLTGTQSDAGNKKCSSLKHIKQKKGDEKKNTLIFRVATFYIQEG